MASNNPYIVVLVYSNLRMRNGNNGVTFECEDPILFRTQRVEALSDLKSLILSKLGGTQMRKIERVTYRLLAPMEVGHSGGGSSVHSTYVQDDRSLAPPPIHVAIPVDEAEEGEEELDEDYVADTADNDLSDSGDEDECVPETPVQTVVCHVLPPPHSIPALSAVPSHYHSLDLDAMHERTPFLDTGEEDYNLDGGVEFQVGHKFRSREAVLQGVKNYNIRRSAEYRVIESDRLKYHVQCRQAENGCQWSLRVALRQNIRYCTYKTTVIITGGDPGSGACARCHMAEAEPGAEVETVEDLRPGQPDLGESEHDTAGALWTVELWHTNVIEAESGNAELPVGSHEAGTGSGGPPLPAGSRMDLPHTNLVVMYPKLAETTANRNRMNATLGALEDGEEVEESVP
ncbi:hypothetical protein Ahy_B04g072022 [Arachis hypogaea]|uniref:Transposase MuDR plant domain-containing protein n=1 Tax=Arachis hypogaea TaxID=3818 RepID=A0A444ZM84_ARAHY|nr:hypothetical protein Ahy_B04g072022 [Arachis hypogaea]